MLTVHVKAPGHLELEGSLTIYEVADAHAELTARLAEQAADQPWRLDLHALGDLDSAGLQLLLALRRQVLGNGAMLVMEGIQGGPLELITLLRLEHLLPAAAAPTA